MPIAPPRARWALAKSDRAEQQRLHGLAVCGSEMPWQTCSAGYRYGTLLLCLCCGFDAGNLFFARRCTREGIGDERVPCLAAEALAHVLISHGACRMAWAEHGEVLSLLGLMRYLCAPTSFS